MKVFKATKLLIKSVYAEVIIICILIFCFNNYIGNSDITISSDGVGYYDYLPSVFIYHDLVRKDIPISTDSSIYKRVLSTNLYNNISDYKVNKYPVGTALLQSPFFFVAYLCTPLDGNSNDGYQEPFQKAVFYSALFYLFLALFFLKKILQLYNIKKYVIILSQLLLVLGTNVTHYVSLEAAFSHVYSLFAITAFIYFVKLFFTKSNVNHFLIACILFGIILLIRQINFIIIFFVPFLAGSIPNLKNGVSVLLKKRIKLIIGFIIIALIFSIQCIAWYLQTGKLFLYSYPGESFNFGSPQVINILFSFRKGLFVYTPVLIISIIALIWLTFKRNYYLVITWFLFFIILTYVLSSWYCWYYGCSFGLRAYIDYYTVFFILIALLINGLHIILKIPLIVISLMAIPINIIQTYQYKEMILLWDEMNLAKYKKVFLKTDKPFAGMLWKRNIKSTDYICVNDFIIGNLSLQKKRCMYIWSVNSLKVSDFSNISIIQVSLDNDFNEDSESRVTLTIKDKDCKKCYYQDHRYLVHFADGDINGRQRGTYNFEISTFKDNKIKIISIEVLSGNQDINLENIRIKFLCRKSNH